MTKLYTVEWSNQLDAETPLDAVRQALGMLRDPENTATFWRVSWKEAGEDKTIFQDFEDQLQSGISCPECGSENIYIVQVECMQHADPHHFALGEVALGVDGFEWWTHAGAHHDWSTTNEVAECMNCNCRGDLDKFGFGEN